MRTASWMLLPGLAMLLATTNAAAQEEIPVPIGKKYIWGRRARGPVKDPQAGQRKAVAPAEDFSDYDGFFGKMPGGLPIPGGIPPADTTYTGDGFTAPLKPPSVGPRKKPPQAAAPQQAEDDAVSGAQVNDAAFKEDMREAVRQLPSAYDTGHLTHGSAALHLMPMLDPDKDAKELEILNAIEKADNWGEKPKGYPSSARDYLISRLDDYRKLKGQPKSEEKGSASGQTEASGE